MEQNLKLISVRIDPQTLTKIDQFASSHYFWKRNTIINAILSSVFKDFDRSGIYDMVRRSDHDDGKVSAKYEIVKTQIPY